jgi:hypothetical protein
MVIIYAFSQNSFIPGVNDYESKKTGESLKTQEGIDGMGNKMRIPLARMAVRQTQMRTAGA